MKNFFNNLPESYKEIIKVVLPFTIMIFLFVVVGKFGISQITKLRNQISNTRKVQTILTEKLSILKSISSSSVQNVTLVTAALPGSSPSLVAISQLKRIAVKNAIYLADIKAGGSSIDTSNLSSVNISFLATGPRSNIMAFLTDIEKIVPITRIDKVKITENGGIESANINIKSYWSLFPKTIPTVTQAITDLSVSEKLTLTLVNEFLQPLFSETSPSRSDINTAPFGQ